MPHLKIFILCWKIAIHHCLGKEEDGSHGRWKVPGARNWPALVNSGHSVIPWSQIPSGYQFILAQYGGLQPAVEPMYKVTEAALRGASVSLLQNHFSCSFSPVTASSGVRLPRPR